MAGSQQDLDRAAAAHRLAAALATAVAERLNGGSRPGPVDDPGSDPAGSGGWYGIATADLAPVLTQIRELSGRLWSASTRLAPGWLSDSLAPAVNPEAGLGDGFGGHSDQTHPQPAAGDPPDRCLPADRIRIGTAHPLPGVSFPVLVPLGHLWLDADGSDPQAVGLLQALLFRLLASAPAGRVLVRAIDPASDRFTRFNTLHRCGITAPPATDRAGMRAALTEAEQWVRGRAGADGRRLVLVVAGWPAGTGDAEADRLAALAAHPATAGLTLLVVGWPRTTGPERCLSQTTRVAIPDPGQLAGGGSAAAAAEPPPAEPAYLGLAAPVRLDQAPPDSLVDQVCAALAGQAADPPGPPLTELVTTAPANPADPATGLSVVLGRGSSGPVTVRLAGPTPHWLLVGRAGAGRTALLLDIHYGLSRRYPADQLEIQLVDLGAGRRLNRTAYRPDRRPDSARPATVVTDRTGAVALLRALAARLDAPAGPPPTRVVCLIDEVGELLVDGPGSEPVSLLARLVTEGGRHGVHLVMTNRDTAPEPVAAGCRVRIALPGGSAALDAANSAAAGLAPGTAIVNTAGGLGGPRGATRAHERLVRFPDPYAEPILLSLRPGQDRLADWLPTADQLAVTRNGGPR